MKILPYFVILLALLAVFLVSCNKEEPIPNSPAPAQVKKDAVEILMLTKTLPNGRVVFQFNRNYFVNSSQLAHLVNSDTLPFLGDTTITTAVYNEDDDSVGTKPEHIHKQYDVLFKVDTLKDGQTVPVPVKAVKH